MTDADGAYCARDMARGSRSDRPVSRRRMKKHRLLELGDMYDERLLEEKSDC